MIILSIFSWTVIITKGRQLYRARKAGKKFFKAYRETRDPLELARRGEEFDGAPAYELYYTGAEETEYHLKNNPVQVEQGQSRGPACRPERHRSGDRHPGAPDHDQDKCRVSLTRCGFPWSGRPARRPWRWRRG